MSVANPQRGQLGFEVAGEHYTLAFTTNALCAIEEEFDLDDISGLEKVLNDKPSLRTIRKLFRIGLTDDNADMTDLEAGDLMQAVGGLEPSLQLIMLAVEQAFPEAAASGTADPTGAGKPSRGNGARSTQRGARSGGTQSSSGG